MHAQRVRRSLCDFIMMNAHLNGFGARCEIVVADWLQWFVVRCYVHTLLKSEALTCVAVFSELYSSRSKCLRTYVSGTFMRSLLLTFWSDSDYICLLFIYYVN